MQMTDNQLIHIVMRTLPKNTYVYQVMQWLNTGRSITSKQANDKLGCSRLAAVISTLRKRYRMPIVTGELVVTNRNKRKVKVANYYLAEVIAC
jgi:hypothetical protein